MGFFNRIFGKKKPSVYEIVELTSQEIIANSIGIVRNLIGRHGLEKLGSNPEKFNGLAWALTFEFIVFSLHLADRISFSALGPDGRSKVMDALIDKVSKISESILKESTPQDVIANHQRFLTLYSERSSFYGPMQMFPEENAPRQGTLSWEAAENTSKNYFPEDLATTTIILSIAFYECFGALSTFSARLS